MAEPLLAAQVRGGGPPWAGRASTTGRPHPRAHSLRLRPLRRAKETNRRILGTGEEIRVPGEGPRRRGGSVRTRHRQWPRLGMGCFSLFNTYNKTLLNETALFEDLLYNVFSHPRGWLRHSEQHKALLTNYERFPFLIWVVTIMQTLDLNEKVAPMDE